MSLFYDNPGFNFHMYILQRLLSEYPDSLNVPHCPVAIFFFYK